MRDRYIFFIGFGVGIVFTSLVAFFLYNFSINNSNSNNDSEITTQIIEETNSESLTESTTQGNLTETIIETTTQANNKETKAQSNKILSTEVAKVSTITTQDLIQAQPTTNQIQTQKVSNITTQVINDDEKIETTTIKRKEIKLKESIFE